MKGENWFPLTVFWPPHVCRGTCVPPTYTHVKCVVALKSVYKSMVVLTLGARPPSSHLQLSRLNDSSKQNLIEVPACSSQDWHHGRPHGLLHVCHGVLVLKEASCPHLHYTCEAPQTTLWRGNRAPVNSSRDWGFAQSRVTTRDRATISYAWSSLQPWMVSWLGSMRFPEP